MADVVKTQFKLKYSEQFNLKGLEEADINLQLDQIENLSSAVYGVVTDGENPVADATVKLFDGDGVPYKHTLTDEDGNYNMDGVPEGTYTIGVVKKGYIFSNTVGVTLSAGSTAEINLQVFPEPTLELGAIAGIVYTIDGKNIKMPIGDVRVTLLDINNVVVAVATTIDDGEFAFYDVLDGRYQIITTAEGYLRETMTVTIKDGSIVNLTMVISRDNRTYSGTVSGIIKDGNGNVLPLCFVGLYRIFYDDNNVRRETLVAVTKTNTTGKYMFGQVGDGEYLVKAKRNAVVAVIDNVTL